jgi:hypothetical protein
LPYKYKIQKKNVFTIYKMSSQTIEIANNVTESVVDAVENVVSETTNVVESVVSETTNVVESVVEESSNGAEEIAGKVVGGIVNNLVKPEKTPVSFVVDVESKAIVESMAEALDNFTVDKLMDVLPRLISHVENYRNLSGPEKRSLVIRMLNHIIDITDCPGDDEIWDPILKRLVPSIIDSMIKVENKQLRLRKRPKCFGRLLSCMS